VTKGDNIATNAVPDPWYVTQNDYAGTVLLVIPKLGYVSPTLWGFRGGLVLLPLGFVFALVLFASVWTSTARESKGGTGSSQEVEERDG
jgi:hypothetical protein